MSLVRVVILGGGPGGIQLAQKLHGVADVTLIDRKDYFEITWASVRAHVEPSIGDRISVPFADIPKLGTVITASVISASEKEVVLDNGVSLTFDYLVIATGTGYSEAMCKAENSPSLEDRLAGFKEGARKLAEAKSVLIVGGGPTGVEIAAEIATDCSGKIITLVHSADRLLNGRPKGISKAAKNFLEKKGVRVVLNEKVVKGADGAFTLSTGEKVSADVVYMSTGSKPNTGFFKSALKESLTANGAQIQVDKFLHVAGLENVFSIGDLTDVKENKLGVLAKFQADAVAKSITALAKDGATAKLTEYKAGGGLPDVMMISLGRNAGTGNIGYFHPWSWMVASMKSKGLFIEKTRQDFGIV